MRRVLLSISILVLSLSPVFSQNEALFNEAGKLYKADSFSQAQILYDSLLSQGFESAPLYYNLGNAYYKQGKLGMAILNYEKALKLDPADGDVKHNLQLANQQIAKVESVPEFFLIRIWNNARDLTSSNTWTIIAIIFSWLCLTAGFFFLFGKSMGTRRLGFWLGMVSFILALFVFSLAGSRKAEEVDDSWAIMTQTNFFVKSAPGDGSSDLFQIREGVKVQIVDEVDGWYRIKLSDGKDGWITIDQIDRI